MNELGIRDRELDRVISGMGAAFAQPHVHHRVGCFKKSKAEKITKLIESGVLHQRIGKDREKHKKNLDWSLNFNTLDPSKAHLILCYSPPRKRRRSADRD